MGEDTTTTTPVIGMELSPTPPPSLQSLPSPLSPPALLGHSSDEVVDSSASLASPEFESYNEYDLHSPVHFSSSSGMSASMASLDSCRGELGIDINDQDEAERSKHVEQSLSLTAGHKIVFDNIDKNVKPRYMRSDSQTKSLHYVQAYAVKDRIDFSPFSNKPATEISAFDVLPSQDDYTSLKAHFSILISRLIVKYIPFFTDDFKGLPVEHIPHRYAKEMSQKSEIVSFR